MSKLHPTILNVTKRIIERSKLTRQNYLNNIQAMERDIDSDRSQVSCSNMAHAAAAAPIDARVAVIIIPN